MDKFVISHGIDHGSIHRDNGGGSLLETLRRFHGIPLVPYKQDDSEGYEHKPENNTPERTHDLLQPGLAAYFGERIAIVG